MNTHVLTRWAMPLLLIVSAVLLSAFVFFVKLPASAQVMTFRAAAAFLGAPITALVVLGALRFATRGAPQPDRGGDLVVIWIVTFLFGLHAAILGAIVGMVPSLRAVVPAAVAFLLVGLGPAIATLSLGSPLGIRTPETLRDERLWLRTHRVTGGLIVVAGILGLVGVGIGGPWALVAGVGPAVVALLVGLLIGSQSAPSNSPEQSDEQSLSSTRLPDESKVEVTDA